MSAEFTLPDGWRASRPVMADAVRYFDWSTTPLGARETWSASLELALDLVLASAFPMALRWGPDFVLIYNDGYAPILGDKHPWALGRPAREAWSEVWAQIEPVHLAIVEKKTPAVFAEDTLLRIKRHGEQWEDARFTLSYSPVKDASSSQGVGGILVTAVETTARFEAERALRVTEERYELALSSAGVVGTWDWDIASDRVFANKKFAEMYSVDPAEAAAGAPIARFLGGIHPDDQARVGDEIGAALTSSSSFESEYRLRQSAGETVWVFARGEVYRDENSKPLRLAGTTVDISARRKIEDELARSEAEFRGFAQAMPNHVWASRPDGLLDWFNEQVYRYSGEAAGSLDGTGWTRMVHPDDLAEAGQSWSTALAAGDVYQTEFRLRRADGAYRWHIARAVPLRSDSGEIIRWIGTNTDIEAQKATTLALADLNQTLARRVNEQAAERDRLWQTSQDILVVVDSEGVFRAANPAWTRILGWRIDEVVGRHHLELNHAEDRRASGDAHTQALNTPLQNYESRILHRDGSFRWFSWVASHEDGFVYASGRDITAEKAAEAELEATQEALRQSQKMEAVGQLTGGIAHDFNNLLAAVSGSFSMIERRLRDGKPGSDRYIAAGQDAVRRAASLTQRLLAFSRRQTLDPKPVDVNKLIAGMEDLIRRTVGPDVVVEVVGAAGLWATKIDASQLESALLNLCINARDAMAPAGGRLTIETANKWLDERAARERDLAPGQYLSLCVTDTGTGMDAETIARAFDPFFTTKPIGQGTGLGLSMVYGFTRQSGGQVRVYSELGKGTTMCMYLPRFGGTLETETPGETMAPVEGGSGETILVIDDEATLRMVIVDVLREHGYHVLQAGAGPEGLRILQSTAKIDLLVTDVGLPGGLNGRQVADAARLARPDLKVLFITGYAENAAVGNGHLEAGMSVMTKPFVIAEFASKIRDLLDQ